MGFFAAVPSSWSGSGSANYAGANFTFRDVTTNNHFTVGVIFYTTLPTAEYISFDGGPIGTNMPMVVTYFGSQTLITTTTGSASIRKATWNDEPWFGFCFSRNNIEHLVNQINIDYPGSNFSIQNLGIGGAHIGAEISTGSSGLNDGYMATRIREWNIYVDH